MTGSDTATLELRLRVTYDLNGTPVEAMKEQLNELIDHAASSGLLSGYDHPAVVDDYQHEVNVIETR